MSKTVKIGGEKIAKIPLTELYPPDFHPFNVNDDSAMSALVESVKQYGVREPGLARKREGGYELLCGNRRKRACEIAGIATLPVIICELDDDNAVIAMVDSNLQRRENLLPSEKAWAYRVKMEALKHGGVKGESHSYKIMVEQTGESKNQIFRTIRLTELVPALADMVDSKRLAFNPAVELSYLSRKEQAVVADVMAEFEVKPSLSQAVRLKKLKQSGELTSETINRVLSEEKKSAKSKQTDRYRRFFPTGYSAKQIDTVITKLLTNWQKGVAV
jgi:ParB family chromosome partitioning protein